MRLFQYIKNQLSKPYPGPETLLAELKGQAVAGFIVFLILFLFKPFGMSFYEGNQIFIAALFGLVAFISGSAVGLITNAIFKTQKDIADYTFGHWILEIIFLLIGVAIGNFLVVSLFLGSEFSFRGFLHMLLATVTIGIFPVVFFGMRNQIKLERKFASEAGQISSQLENKTETAQEVVLAAESMQNYVHIYSITNGKFQKRTERSTLSEMHSKIGKGILFKCHRSFLVNLSQVSEVSGNAQGLILKLRNEDCPNIPTSRSYVKIVREELEKNQS